MSARIEKVKISSLVINEALWPRRVISRVNISRICEAIRCGKELPPIIVDRITRTVIDGVHRLKAVARIFGPVAEIMVEWRDYDNEAAMFIDAARLNAGHGEPLTPIDQAFCLHRAEELKIERPMIMSALNLSKPAVERICSGRFGFGPTGECIVLKRSVGHLAGENLTERQVAANERVGGFPVREYVEQLITFIEGGLLKQDGDIILEGRLRHLQQLLTKLLAVPA